MAVSTAMRDAAKILHQNGIAPRGNTLKAMLKRELVEVAPNGKFTLTRDGRNSIAEIIDSRDRILRTTGVLDTALSPTMKAGRGDYGFWDRLQHCQVRGLEIAGLLVKPLYSKIASWVMGDAPALKYDNAATSEEMTNWWEANHAKVLETYQNSLALGDSYAVVNADETLTILPPNVIKPLVSDDNFGDIIGYVVDEVFQHPTEPSRSQRRRNEYYANRRVETVTDTRNNSRLVTIYPNLIGRIPVVRIPNNKGSDEMFGRSEGEALVPLLHRYNELLDAAMDGNMHQGRPTPTFERMGTKSQLDAFWAQNARSETITHADGTTEIKEYLPFDSDKVVLVGGEGTFHYAQPGPFTTETTNLLTMLFYLYIQHTEMPEFIMGNAIASSNASADAQMPPFVKFMNKKRGQVQEWLLDLLGIVLAIKSLYDVSVRTDEVPGIEWKDLTGEDGRLTLDTLIWAQEKSLIDDETALRMMPAKVENPAEVLKKAKKEAEERKAEFDAQVGSQIRAQAGRAESPAGDSPTKQIPPRSEAEDIWRNALNELANQEKSA